MQHKIKIDSQQKYAIYVEYTLTTDTTDSRKSKTEHNNKQYQSYKVGMTL